MDAMKMGVVKGVRIMKLIVVLEVINGVALRIMHAEKRKNSVVRQVKLAEVTRIKRVVQ
jgi:hypothetical protein